MLPAPVPGAPLLVVVIVTLVPPPASSALLSAPESTVAVLTPESGVKTFPIKDALVVPDPMVTSAGSSSHVPLLPNGALALTVMPVTSST